MSNFQQQDRIFTILDTGKLTMWAPNGEGKFSSLRFNVNKKNQVVVTVYTNIPSDTTEDGKIKAVIEPDTFYAWLNMAESMALKKEDDRSAVTYKDKKFIGQGRMTDGPVEHYTLIAGRDEGIVFLSVTAPNRPNIKFGFLSNTKHMFRDASGNEMDKSKESTFVALGRLKMMRDYIMAALDTAKAEIQRKPQQGGGNGGGNRSFGGGSNYSGGKPQGGGAGGGFGSSDEIPW